MGFPHQWDFNKAYKKLDKKNDTLVSEPILFKASKQQSNKEDTQKKRKKTKRMDPVQPRCGQR